MPWAVQGRMLVYAIVYSLGATRCIILHLATSESLQHAIGVEDGSLMLCGLAVAFVSLALVQVTPPIPHPPSHERSEILNYKNGWVLGGVG